MLKIGLQQERAAARAELQVVAVEQRVSDVEAQEQLPPAASVGRQTRRAAADGGGSYSALP